LIIIIACFNFKHRRWNWV